MRWSDYLLQSAKFKRKVLSLLNRGVKQIEIARRMGVSRQRINQIIHPERTYARGRINGKVASKSIPRAARLICVDCGKRAKEYDHPNYKSPDTVDAVCAPCHRKRTVTRRRNGHKAASK